MISVLIPAYNVEKYINEALESILNQSFSDIEIIIVDDCSTDSTYDICKLYATKDNRIRLFKNDANLGIAKSLNFALANSKGEYIIRMDADDISENNRSETMYKFLLNNPSIDIVGSATTTIDEDGNVLGEYYPLEKHLDLVKTLKWASPLLHIWMCKKSIYKKIGNYRFPPIEDYDFLLRCISEGMIVHNIMEPLYRVRLRNGNTAELYGFRQLRAFESVSYAYKKNRLKELDVNLKSSLFSEWLYQLSRNLYFNGTRNIKNGHNVYGIIFLLSSAVLSPYQLRYIYRRIRLHLFRKGLYL